MFRLTQTLQNLFLRFEGFFGVLGKNLFSLAGNFLGFFAKIFGLTQPSYFLEDNTEVTRQTPTEKPLQIAQDKTLDIPSTTRRNPKMDDFYLNMARQVEKK
jgi:hypothetical protein